MVLSLGVALRAEIIRATSSFSTPRNVCTTSKSKMPPAIPMLCQRSSFSSMRSRMLTTRGSSKISVAVSKLTQCFARLRIFFRPSHSKHTVRTGLYISWHTYMRNARDAGHPRLKARPPTRQSWSAGATRIIGAGGVGLGLGGGVSFGVATWRGVLWGWRAVGPERRLHGRRRSAGQGRPFAVRRILSHGCAYRFPQRTPILWR